MGKIMSFDVYRKRYGVSDFARKEKNKPKHFTLEGSMLNRGFTQEIHHFENCKGKSPRELILSLVNKNDYELVVYKRIKSFEGVSCSLIVYYLPKKK